MSVQLSGTKRRSPIQVIQQWWQAWTSNGPALANPCCSAESEVERIANRYRHVRRRTSPACQSRSGIRRPPVAPNGGARSRSQRGGAGGTANLPRSPAHLHACVKATGNARVICCAIQATLPGKAIVRTSPRSEHSTQYRGRRGASGSAGAHQVTRAPAIEIDDRSGGETDGHEGEDLPRDVFADADAADRQARRPPWRACRGAPLPAWRRGSACR